MKKRKSPIPSSRDLQRALASDAMPDVKRLVAKYGTRAVGNFLGKIKARDKELAKLQKLRNELAEREKALQ